MILGLTYSKSQLWVFISSISILSFVVSACAMYYCRATTEVQLTGLLELNSSTSSFLQPPIGVCLLISLLSPSLINTSPVLLPLGSQRTNKVQPLHSP